MGFGAMGELTHAMEDVFDELRHGKADSGPEMIDALFAALDLLKAMKEELSASGSTSLDASEHTQRLRASLAGPVKQGVDDARPIGPESRRPAITLSETQRMAVQAARDETFSVCLLSVSVTPGP